MDGSNFARDPSTSIFSSFVGFDAWNKGIHMQRSVQRVGESPTLFMRRNMVV